MNLEERASRLIIESGKSIDSTSDEAKALAEKDTKEWDNDIDDLALYLGMKPDSKEFNEFLN